MYPINSFLYASAPDPPPSCEGLVQRLSGQAIYANTKNLSKSLEISKTGSKYRRESTTPESCQNRFFFLLIASRSSVIIYPNAHLGTLEYLLTKSDDPSVQSLAGVLPQKALQSKIEPGLDAGRYLQEMVKWKHWADGQGVKVFPVELEALQHYLTHIVEEDVRRVERAVIWIHQQASYPYPTGSKLVQSSLDELKRNLREGCSSVIICIVSTNALQDNCLLYFQPLE